MNTNKTDSLFQSMEKWIDLYRDKHGCSHNDAHDAFEAWSDKLRGESADQTTKSFHEAVVASYNDMRGVVIVDNPREPKPVSFTNSKGETVTSKAVGDRYNDALLDPTMRYPGPRPTLNMSVGGPLLELPHESRLADSSLATTNIREEWKKTQWSVPGQSQGGPAPVGGPILETGKDPLAFTQGSMDKLAHEETFQPIYPPVVTPAELRANLEKAVSDTNKYLDELSDVAHPSDLARVKEVNELAEGRLKMLDELEVREKERKGKRLSLKGN